MPKLYFSGADLKIPKGGSVHVQYTYGAFFTRSLDRIREGLANAIHEGRKAVGETMEYMQKAGVGGLNMAFRSVALRYMKTDLMHLTQDEFDAIFSVLRLTDAGINNSDLAIKVFSKIGASRGYVRNYPGITTDHSNRTPGLRRQDDGTLVPVFKGDIHMGFGGITGQPLLAAKNFVHEATHKFANTADFGERGYTWDDTGEYRGTEDLTKEEALMNAESYARLAVHFYTHPQRHR